MLNKIQQKDFRIGSLFLIVMITFGATAYVRVVEKKVAARQSGSLSPLTPEGGIGRSPSLAT